MRSSGYYTSQDHANQAAALFAAPAPAPAPDSAETEEDKHDPGHEAEIPHDRGYDGGSSDYVDEDGPVEPEEVEDDPAVTVLAPAATNVPSAKDGPADIQSSSKSTKPSVTAKPANKQKSTRKRPYGDSSDIDGLEELHAMELKEESKRREEKNKVRMLELEIQASRQKLEADKLQAKREKLALQREQLEADKERQAQANMQFQMMMSAMGQRFGVGMGGAAQQGAPAQQGALPGFDMFSSSGGTSLGDDYFPSSTGNRV
ncbi:hypothetical protein NMY22_g7954 [Coprinellus aureogranulatus]|nr:hypothetical protein NMY22_g7954 [Coprinellus aureogranulatus]